MIIFFLAIKCQCVNNYLNIFCNSSKVRTVLSFLDKMN